MTILAEQGVRDEQPAMTAPAAVFCDSAESEFYARCVKEFLLRRLPEPLRQEPVVELGTGTGEAIAKVLKETRFAGEIHGYEIQAEACEYASEVIRRYGVAGYQVLNHDFFTAVPDHLRGRAISNPPYLPAPDPEINMPELWGGPDGSDVIARLLGSGFGQLVTTMSSFSNPLGTIDRATGHGYKVADFALTTMRFGAYSSEPKVRAQIERLANQRPRRAFIAENGYCLAAVLWSRTADADLTRGLQAAITSLHP